MEGGLHIAFAADATFVPHCAAMIHSLTTHHTAERLQLHFLHDEDLDVALLDQLSTYATSLGVSWEPCHVAEGVRSRFPDHHRFGRVAWYRIALPELLPELHQVLYLDSDLIVTDSLEELWATDLSRAPLAAVTNPLYPGTPMSFLHPMGVPSVGDYFNSGVLLLNLDVWRRECLTDAVERFIVGGEQLDLWPDQNALNAVLWPRRRHLAPRWNVQNTLFDLDDKHLPFGPAEIEQARRCPAIVHFIGPYKPWHYRSKHPLRRVYFDHLNQTPWAGRPIDGRTVTQRILRLFPSALGVRVERRARDAWARVRQIFSP